MMKQRKGLTARRYSELKKPRAEPRWAQPKTSFMHQLYTKAVIKSGLAHRRAIKGETIAMNRDWVYNKTYRLSHGVIVIPNFL